MNKLGTRLAYIAAGIVLLSSIMHTLMGWPAISAELAKTNTPRDLVEGLAMAWHLGGMFMLALGVTLLHLLRTGKPSGFVLTAFGLGYTLFGSVAFALTSAGFMFTFIVPGVLMLAGAYLRR